MSFNITDTYGVSAPSEAFVNESRRTRRVTRHIVRDEDAEIVRLRGGKVKEVEVVLRGKGDPGFAGVAPGPFTEGAMKITKAEGTEMANGEYPDFEITAMGWENPA